jgi:hypothetical protein
MAQSNTFASLPIRLGEWASELEINVNLSNADQRQFI